MGVSFAGDRADEIHRAICMTDLETVHALVVEHINAAVAEEREVCARLAEGVTVYAASGAAAFQPGPCIADLIRMRGK